MKVFFLFSDKSTTSSCDTGGRRSFQHEITGQVIHMRSKTFPYIALVGHFVQQPLLDSQQVGRGRHHHVDEDLRNDGDQGVLPGEGIQQGCYGMDDLG